ncbi:hypothetical protein ACFWF7_29830 [Nocardia sp. NPDC060256]|uniref:hypothetical protein n=1 Tax=unclassified Nocardia TaxID=2637762 RepID=UPI003660725F
MGEQFEATPSEIAGLSKLMTDIGKDAWHASEFIQKEGPPAEWVSAIIIDDLLDPLKSFAELTRQRMLSIGTVTADTALELNNAAWLYHDKDRQTYEALNRHKTNLLATGDQSVPVYSDKEAVGATSPYESAAQYPKPQEVKLDAPSGNKEELIALIGDVAPPLGAVNDTVKRLTKSVGREYDPLGEALKPIPGNWTEIRRIGEAYKIAGEAMENCGKNLESGVKRLDPHWNGKAALSFNDWASKQIAAMQWEGPTGRILGEALGKVSDEIRDAVRSVLKWLWELLESQVKIDGITDVFKFAFKKIPVVGWTAQITELAIKLAKIVSDALTLVDKIQKLVDATKKFLEVIKDPVKAAQDKGNQKFEELVEPFAKGVKAADILNDARKAADLSQTNNRPTDYDVGAGTQPWDNA